MTTSEQRFVTYFRVSTDRQGRSGLGLEAQQEAVRQFLSGRNVSVIAEFVEVESGTKSDRPKLQEALATCRHERATLLIAKLDRLARSVSFIANLMDGETEFVAVDMPYASRFLLHVLAAVAEHERQVIAERTKSALAAAKARGVRLGINGSVLADRHREAAESYAATIRDHFDEAFASGARTTVDIAEHLNRRGLPSRQGGRWHSTSVARVLKRLGPLPTPFIQCNTSPSVLPG